MDHFPQILLQPLDAVFEEAKSLCLQFGAAFPVGRRAGEEGSALDIGQLLSQSLCLFSQLVILSYILYKPLVHLGCRLISNIPQQATNIAGCGDSMFFHQIQAHFPDFALTRVCYFFPWDS